MKKGATISACGKYRYELWREWDSSLPKLVFIMLNPSTADASKDDPTIRRCIGFAKREGCGSVSIINLFAYRSSDPKELIKVGDPFGDNENFLKIFLYQDTRIIAAWGNIPKGLKMPVLEEVEVECLGITKLGNPKHPLYLPSDAKLEKYILGAVK
jgi:hypothetical protein